MIYDDTFDPRIDLFVDQKNDKPKSVLSVISRGIQFIFRPLIAPKDKDLEQLILGSGFRFPVNDRSWKRNSALLIYSQKSRGSIR